MHATEILQTYLDEVSQAVLTGDWETCCTGICLPCHIISHDESKVVTTVADLKAGFDMFRATLQAQRMSEDICLVESAQQLDRALIAGRYITHLIAGSHRLMPPFWSEMTLRLVDNTWHAAAVTNGLANSRWPLVRLELNTDSALEGSNE